MSLTLGHITLKNNVIVAPMSGISDLPFRRIANKFGAGMVVSEMVASQELARARPDVVRRAEGDKAVSPFVIQLAGREAKWMAEGAKLAELAGADIIDINMGCPSRQVTGALSGSALMRDLDHAMALVEAVVENTSRPVTLKMRLGWDHQNLNASELATRAEAAGIVMVTVHGRTRNQFYKGRANWAAIKPVVEAVSIPVIANGDIVDVGSANVALMQSGAAGIMIGRASVGQPWLAASIAASLSGDEIDRFPTLLEQRAIVIEHYKDMIAHYGEPLGVQMARKHLAAYLENAPLPMSFAERKIAKSQICQISSAENVLAALESFYRDGVVVNRQLTA